MKGKNTKQYNDDGIIYTFNFDQLYHSFSQLRLKRGKECSVQKLEEELGNKIGISPATIHTWRNGNSAPSSLELIEALAIELEIRDYHDLLKKERSVNKMTIDYELEKQRMEAINRIYNNIFEFLQEFRDQQGYLELQRVTRDPDALDEILSNSYPKDKKTINELHNIELCGSVDQEVIDVITFIIDNKVFDIMMMFECTAVPLRGTEIYSALREYIDNDFKKFVYSYYDFWCGEQGCYDKYFEVVEKLQKVISNYL